jgi:hypothetical protein
MSLLLLPTALASVQPCDDPEDAVSGPPFACRRLSRGFQWVRYGPDLLLVSVTTGQVSLAIESEGAASALAFVRGRVLVVALMLDLAAVLLLLAATARQ